MKTWRTESDGGTSENRWRDRHRAVGPWTEDKAEAEADAEHGSMRGALQLSDMSEPNDECVTDPEEHSHCARGTYGCGTDHSVWLAWRNEKDRRPQEAPARTAPVLAKDGVTRMHYLKCWPMPLRDVISGAKPFEYRKHDRDYRVGDVLVLEEWEPNKAAYVQGGLATSRVVTYFLPGGTFGVPEGYCVMGIAPWEESPRVDNPTVDRAEVEARIAQTARIQTRERCAQELYDLARWCRDSGLEARARHTESCARRLQGVDDQGNVVLPAEMRPVQATDYPTVGDTVAWIGRPGVPVGTVEKLTPKVMIRSSYEPRSTWWDDASEFVRCSANPKAVKP